MGSFARECVSPVAISGGDIKQDIKQDSAYEPVEEVCLLSAAVQAAWR